MCELSAWLNRMNLEGIGGLRFGLFQPEALPTFRAEEESRSNCLVSELGLQLTPAETIEQTD